MQLKTAKFTRIIAIYEKIRLRNFTLTKNYAGITRSRKSRKAGGCDIGFT